MNVSGPGGGSGDPPIKSRFPLPQKPKKLPAIARLQKEWSPGRREQGPSEGSLRRSGTLFEEIPQQIWKEVLGPSEYQVPSDQAVRNVVEMRVFKRSSKPCEGAFWALAKELKTEHTKENTGEEDIAVLERRISQVEIESYRSVDQIRQLLQLKFDLLVVRAICKSKAPSFQKPSFLARATTNSGVEAKENLSGIVIALQMALIFRGQVLSPEKVFQDGILTSRRSREEWVSRLEKSLQEGEAIPFRQVMEVVLSLFSKAKTPFAVMEKMNVKKSIVKLPCSGELAIEETSDGALVYRDGKEGWAPLESIGSCHLRALIYYVGRRCLLVTRDAENQWHEFNPAAPKGSARLALIHTRSPGPMINEQRTQGFSLALYLNKV